MQELIGMKIGPYQIQRHLARGGMANVYLACDVETEMEPSVAVKLVHTSIGDYCERFCREAKAHYTLHHDHILPALAYGELDSWWYLITPYIGGGTLANCLKHGPLSIENATEVFSQLASALHYAHERGIIHRDIKASNVLMRDEHYAYLADFGLVKHVGFDASLTASGYIIGTPEYMAPELAEEGATPRSDIYALGVLLYQMLTGQVPFRGNSPFTLYIKHLQEYPVNPAALNPAVPPEVGRVVLCALAKDPDDRYQTAQDFNIAYQQALAQAKTRQAEGIAMVLDYDTTLPVPQVRFVKEGNLRHPDGLQEQAAISTGRRKTSRGVVVPMVALILLMLSLLSASGIDARQLSLTGLVTQPIVHIAHAKVNPTPDPSPPVAPIPQSIAMPQQIAGHNDNSNRGNSHGNRGKQGNEKGFSQFGGGNGQADDSSGNGPGNRGRQGNGNNGKVSSQFGGGNGQADDGSGNGPGNSHGGSKQGNGNDDNSSGHPAHCGKHGKH